MNKTHIVAAYDDDLKNLQSKVIELGRACVSQLNKTIEALSNKDTELARKTVKEDKNVNKLQHEVDQLSIKLLAMRQPVAGDLRNVIGGLRIATDLERIADYAANISQVIIDIAGVEIEHPLQLLIQMCEIALEMLEGAVTSYIEADEELAVHIWHMDDKLDKTYSALLDQLRSCMMEDKKSINACTQLIFGARCSERMGDHITNVVEGVYYIKTGKEYHGD